MIWIGGKAFESQLDTLLDFIGKYQWWLVGGLLVLSFLQSSRRMKQGRSITGGPTDDPLD